MAKKADYKVMLFVTLKSATSLLSSYLDVGMEPPNEADYLKLFRSWVTGIPDENNTSTDLMVKQTAALSILVDEYYCVYGLKLQGETLIRMDTAERKGEAFFDYLAYGKYSAFLNDFSRKIVASEDREMFLDQSRTDRVVENIKNAGKYVIGYRGVTDGKTRYLQNRYIQPSLTCLQDYILIGIRDAGAAYADKPDEECCARQSGHAWDDAVILIDMNLSENKYRIIRYGYFGTCKAPSEGRISVLVNKALELIPKDTDRNRFLSSMSLERLLAAFKNGNRSVSVKYLRLISEGGSREVETTCVFHEENGKIYALSFTWLAPEVD